MSQKFYWTQSRVAVIEVLQQSDCPLKSKEIKQLVDHDSTIDSLRVVLLQMWRVGIVERQGRSHSYRYSLTEEGRKQFEFFEKGAIAS